MRGVWDHFDWHGRFQVQMEGRLTAPSRTTASATRCHAMPLPTAKRATAGGSALSTALSATLNAVILSSWYACARVWG